MDLTGTDRDRLERQVVQLLSAGQPVEIYTSITGKVLALYPAEPMTDSFYADDFLLGYACAICDIYQDSPIGCGHNKP